MSLHESYPGGYLEVPGGRIWYRVAGAGAGIPLLTLHGGPGSPHDYLESLAALGGERPVVFYDQLGCGRSDHPDDPGLWTMSRFLEEIDCVRTGLGLDQIHLYGHSWGAMLAVDYALAEPEGLCSLILASPCLSMAKVQADLTRLKDELPPAILKVLREHEQAGTTHSAQYQVAALAFYRRHICRLSPWPAALEQSFASWGHQVYTTMWGPAEFNVTGNLRDYDRSGRLGELSVPVLFLCGRHDEITPETTGWFHELCPASEFVVFEDSAHLPQLEEPDTHAEIVREFLRRAERAPIASAGSAQTPFSR
ncbi:MAG: proline iminopeptidase-family hydrolase [Isosphaeraceae bacterium]